MGIMTGIGVSLRQLVLQSLLFLLYMLAEIKVFTHLVFGLRKLLPFLAAYWVFALLFSVPYLESVLFSAQVIYLMIVMVGVWGLVDKPLLVSQLRWCNKYTLGRKLISFVLSTYLFLKLYIRNYQNQPTSEKIQGILEHALETGREVQAASPQVAQRVRHILAQCQPDQESHGRQNVLGMVFLACLVLVHSL